MTPKDKLDRLERIAGMMLDRDLALLRRAAQEKAASEERLSGLTAPGSDGGAASVAEALAQLNWQRWADARRAEINVTLALQTAEWLTARETAQRTFARCEALRGVRRRQDQLS